MSRDDEAPRWMRFGGLPAQVLLIATGNIIVGRISHDDAVRVLYEEVKRRQAEEAAR